MHYISRFHGWNNKNDGINYYSLTLRQICHCSHDIQVKVCNAQLGFCFVFNIKDGKLKKKEERKPNKQIKLRTMTQKNLSQETRLLVITMSFNWKHYD